MVAPTALLFIFMGCATNRSGPLALAGGINRGDAARASAVDAAMLVAKTAKNSWSAVGAVMLYLPLVRQ